MYRSALSRSAAIFFAGSSIFLACSADTGEGEPLGSVQSLASVGGCTCPTSGNCAALSYSDIPADGIFYVTTFGGGADTQPMSCGGTADGTWAYVADSARFGCKAKLLIEAKGKSCVAEVRDCGPNRCVEQAACSCSCGNHFPIIDASPFITSYVLGSSSVGWSEKRAVKVTLLDPATPIGCPGGPVSIEAGKDAAADVGAGGSSGAAGAPSGGGGGLGGAGTGGAAGVAGAASGGSAGATPSGGATNKPKGSDDAGGCACHLASRTSPSGAAWLAAFIAAASLMARRRRGGPSTRLDLRPK